MTKRNAIVILLVTATLSLCLVVVLLFLSRDSIYSGGGFVRTFLNQQPALPVDTMDLEFDSYYLAGSASHTVYLGNIVSPFNVIALDAFSFDTTHIRLDLADSDSL